ncbi:hypothetical protein VUR80DRAFT_5118 [Thermomyces stellatus]
MFCDSAHHPGFPPIGGVSQADGRERGRAVYLTLLLIPAMPTAGWVSRRDCETGNIMGGPVMVKPGGVAVRGLTISCPTWL